MNTPTTTDAAIAQSWRHFFDEARRNPKSVPDDAQRMLLEIGSRAAAQLSTETPATAHGEDDDWHLRGYLYASKQGTHCADCGQYKHTPLRIDAMGGYVCLTCIDKKLGSLLGEFGHSEPPAGGFVVVPQGTKLYAPTAQPSAKDGVRVAQHGGPPMTLRECMEAEEATTASGLVDDDMAERFLNEFEGVPNHPRSLSKLQRTKTALLAAIGREVGK